MKRILAPPPLGDDCLRTARHRPNLGQDVPHEDTFALPPLAAPTPAGEPVVIYRAIKGGIEIEGLACRGRSTGAKPFEHWVTFVGESRPRRRRVLPGPFQSQAEIILSGLRALFEDAGVPDMPDVFLSDLLRARATNDNTRSDTEEAGR